MLDLNSDLGESFGRWVLGDDEAMLGLVTSANVACGFHAGDPTTLRRTCAEAAKRDVVVGAQVGYRDLPGFGRRFIEMDLGELADDVLYQIGALDGFCQVAGTRVRYVKPHGALYNTAAIDESQAAAVVAAVVDYDRSLPVLCPPGSVLAQLATGAGLRAVAEGFADRGYQASGALVPRSAPGALVEAPDEVAARAVRMAVGSTVRSVDGVELRLPVESICVHGDTPGAVALARGVRAALERAGAALAAFVHPAKDQG
jgi:UPF0271 protein